MQLEGLIFGGAYIRRGLSTDGNLGFHIGWTSLTVGRRFTVFALFYFVSEGNFPGTSSAGEGGLIFGGTIPLRVFLRFLFDRAFVLRLLCLLCSSQHIFVMYLSKGNM